MNLENRLITNEDIELVKKYRDKQGLVEKYVHPCGTWRNDDATIKWAGSEIIFDKLVEWEEVYDGDFKGTLKSEVG